MATTASRGSGTPVTSGTTWTNVTNAVDGAVGTNPATYAVWTNAVSGGTGYIEISGYNFSSTIGASDTINSVTVTVRNLVSSASRISTVVMQPYDGATAIGTPFTMKDTTTASDDVATFPVTLAQIRSATFKIRVTPTHASNTQSATFSIDHADVSVDYTPAPPSLTQAAYRFYADGTESGSAALANQDTAYTANITAGDVNLLLRVRLQSTTAIAGQSTDDYQLQCEKNGSGTWANVASPILDSYTTNPSGNPMTGGKIGMAQSIMGDGRPLSQYIAYLSRSSGAPPATTISARLYAHSGTYGTSSIPTGTALETSATTFTEADVPTTAVSSLTFNFSGTTTLTAGTPYCVAFILSVTGTSGTNCLFGSRATTPSALVLGNYSELSGSTWTPTTSDLCFQVIVVDNSPVSIFASTNLTDGAATTNRLTGGTGTFQAGKVSKDGLVDDLGWSGSNYTELLYSVTVKQSLLVNGDTLRFRVLYNGATAAMTYTRTPTINVAVVAAPPPNQGSGSASWSMAVSAVGTKTPKGAATTTWAEAVAAVGATPAVVPAGYRFLESGSARNTEDGTARALESLPSPTVGSATVSWTEAVTVIGKETPKANASVSYSEAVTAAGKRTPKSSITTTWTEATAASGKRTPKATSSTTYLEAVTAVGKETPKSTITTTHTWVPSAVGVMPAVGMKQGTAAVSYTENPVSVGKRVPKATAPVTYIEVVAATGTKPLQGSASTTWTEAIAVVGKRTPKSSVITTALQTLAATGKETPKATSTVVHDWHPIAQGIAPVVGVKQGSALVYFTMNPAAVGKRTPKGGNTTTYTEAVTAAGKKPTKSTALTTTYTEAVDSVGKRVSKSTLTTTYTEAVAAVGKRTPKAIAAGNDSWSLIAQGVAPLVGYNKGSALTYTYWNPAAVGQRVPKAIVTVAITWAPSATGKKLQKASGTVSHQWQPVAVGMKLMKGAAGVTYDYVLVVQGKRVPKARGDSDYWFSQVALGVAGMVGVIDGAWNGLAISEMQFGDKAVIDWLLTPP